MADSVAASMKLNGAVTAGTATLTVQADPSAASSGARFVVIDPWTVECEIKRVSSISGSTITLSTNLAYNHASGDTVFYSSLARFDVTLFGAKGNDSTDDTAAIQAAITGAIAISTSTDDAEVWIPQGTYKITDTLDATGGVVIRGQGMRPALKCYHADARLEIGGGTQVHTLYVNGNETGTTGIKVVGGNEGLISDVLIVNAVTYGLWLDSTTANMEIHRLATNGCPTAVWMEGAVACWFYACNFYDSTTVFDFSGGTTYQTIVRDSWFETFDTAFLWDETSDNAITYGLVVSGCYFLSTNGGGSYTARVAKTLAANNTNSVKILGARFEQNLFNMTAAKYLFEVDWNTYTGGGENRFLLIASENYLLIGTNTTAWFSSDNTTVTYVRAVFDNNTGLASKPLTDTPTNPIANVEAFTANDATPSVLTQAAAYYTANSGGTTITAFDDGYPGQVIRVLILDANTTIDFTGTTLKGNAGSDWTPGNGDWLEGVFNGTNWYCSVHDCTA